MADVSFDEEPGNTTVVFRQDSYMVRALIAGGFARDSKTAGHILIGLAVGCVILMGFILASMQRGTTSVPQEEIDAALPIHVRQNRL